MMVLYTEIVELRVWLSLPSRSSFQVEDDSTHAYICPGNLIMHLNQTAAVTYGTSYQWMMVIWHAYAHWDCWAKSLDLITWRGGFLQTENQSAHSYICPWNHDHAPKPKCCSRTWDTVFFLKWDNTSKRLGKTGKMQRDQFQPCTCAAMKLYGME